MTSAKPLNIAFILPENSLAGGVFVTYLQAQALKDVGHAVTILFVKFNPTYGFSHFSKFSLSFQELSKLSPDTHFDVAIATWWETFYELPKIAATHHFYFVQSDERRFYPRNDRLSWGWVELTYSFKSIGIVTEARWIKSFLESEFQLDVAYAPNGVDTEQFSSSILPLAPKVGRLRVLIEGPGALEYKRIDDAFKITEGFDGLEVWYICPDGHVKPEWKFDRLLKAVPFAEMASIYRSCDILIKVSSVEGFFGPPLEMMATGGACIVSDVTGHDEYIRDGENALLIKIGDISAGKAALNKLLSDHSLRERLGKNGMETARRLDWKNQHPKFEAAIVELIQKRDAVPSDILKVIGTLDSLRIQTSSQSRQLQKYGRFRYRFAERLFDVVNRIFPWVSRIFGSRLK